MGFQLSRIRSFQIDHNSTCNLRCPQCARTHNGGLNPELMLKQLPISFYERVFTPEMCAQLDSILFCGNYGDVVASSNIVEVVAYLREAGLRRTTLFTNGSMREVAWWKKLAGELRGKVAFSIDGLADTNAIYRVGSDFSKIIANARAFVEAGGEARWDYLVFEHNEHQVDEAQALARKIGFAEFKIKKTNRFIQSKNYIANELSTTDNVYLPQAANLPAYQIAVPRQARYQADGVSSFEQIVKKHKSWDAYINTTPISCKALNESSMFIDFDGKLWPCTWVAAPIHFEGVTNVQKIQMRALIARLGADFNSLMKYSFEEVLAHPWYSGGLEDSWKATMEDMKLMTCGRTCGKEYEFSSNSVSNREVVSLA